MRAEFQAELRAVNTRIYRVFQAIIGFGAGVIIVLLGIIITLALKL